MKKMKWLLLMTLVFGGCLLSSCSNEKLISRTVLGVDYYAQTVDQGGTAIVYRIMKKDDGGDRLVTEIGCKEGLVKSIIPTPVSWGCTGAKSGDTNRADMAWLSFGANGDRFQLYEMILNADGTTVFNGQKIPEADLPWFAKVNAIDGCLIFIEADMSIPVARLEALVKMHLSDRHVRGLIIRSNDKSSAPWCLYNRPHRTLDQLSPQQFN